MRVIVLVTLFCVSYGAIAQGGSSQGGPMPDSIEPLGAIKDIVQSLPNAPNVSAPLKVVKMRIEKSVQFGNATMRSWRTECGGLPT